MPSRDRRSAEPARRPPPSDRALAALARETAVWLMPATGDRERLLAAIESLATRFGAPVFEPHATVFGAMPTPRDEVEAAVARTARGTPAFTLSVARLAHTPAFFQCLFLELAQPEPVFELRQRLGPELGERPEEAAWPHLSLIYAELAAPEREALSRELGLLELAQAPIRFDALALVAPRRDEATAWNDVEGWRIVGRFPLNAR